MSFVTLDQARAHCKADSADDSTLTLHLNAAVAACQQLANRSIYTDQTALDTALSGISAAMVTANAAYAAALLAADAIVIDADKLVAQDIAYQNYIKIKLTQESALNGIVVTDDINAAILLITGHFYRNREAVVTGQGAAATEVPLSAQNLMAPYRRVGAL